jgi:hypothetical protein
VGQNLTYVTFSIVTRGAVVLRILAGLPCMKYLRLLTCV